MHPTIGVFEFLKIRKPLFVFLHWIQLARWNLLKPEQNIHSTYKVYVLFFRPVGSGAAWRRSAAPTICRERERKGREGRKEREKRRKKREREGEKEKKGRDQERKIYYAYMGVKHLLRTIKRLLKTRKEGGWKKAKKAGREEEETEKAGEKMVTSKEDRLRCENIGSVFYSSIKPYLS